MSVSSRHTGGRRHNANAASAVQRRGIRSWPPRCRLLRTPPSPAGRFHRSPANGPSRWASRASVLPGLREARATYLVYPVPCSALRPAGRAARFRSERDQRRHRAAQPGQLPCRPRRSNSSSARNESDSEQLRGSGRCRLGAEVGGFAEYWPSAVAAHAPRGCVAASTGTRVSVADLHRGCGRAAAGALDAVGRAAHDARRQQGDRALFRHQCGTGAGLRAAGIQYQGWRGIRLAWVRRSAHQWTQQWASRFFVEYAAIAG